MEGGGSSWGRDTKLILSELRGAIVFPKFVKPFSRWVLMHISEHAGPVAAPVASNPPGTLPSLQLIAFLTLFNDGNRVSPATAVLVLSFIENAVALGPLKTIRSSRELFADAAK